MQPIPQHALRRPGRFLKLSQYGTFYRAISTTPIVRQQEVANSRGRNTRSRNSYSLPGFKPNFDAKQSGLRTYELFEKLVESRFNLYISREGSWEIKSEAYRAFGVHSERNLDKHAKLFKHALSNCCKLATQRNKVTRAENPLFWNLRNAFIRGDVAQLTKALSQAFLSFIGQTRFSEDVTATHQRIADFRYPHEWFPATRAMKRTIHLHVGPTNSGKTYNALKALENAKTGIYAGPLRLLAHEVYTRFQAKRKPCALITGEEQRIPEEDDIYFRSCTVEMTPLNLLVDVAVIDEIQMIGDADRGWAWTQAFFGVQAREVHLCGEERSVELIQSLCATIGDECVVHRYERLSPLKAMKKSLRGDWNNLQKGDAIVSFSRLNIHQLKQMIERKTGKRCAIVYGSLPPETRAQQAALFNDPDNDYDFLAASDAIGMGLNLEIKRVIFDQTAKRDGVSYRDMSISEIKQIGGRAGRFRTARQAANESTTEGVPANSPTGPPKTAQPGLVTTVETEDLKLVQSAFENDAEPLQTAGIQPPAAVIERLAAYFPPNTPFSYILMRLHEIAQISPRYHMCGWSEQIQVADIIQKFPMSIYDRSVFLNAPVNLRDPGGIQILEAFARCVSNMDGGHLLDIPEINLDLIDERNEEKYLTGMKPADFLSRLEALHKSVTLYLWLSYRYSGVFLSQALAFHVRELVEKKINYQLEHLSFSEEKRKHMVKKRRAVAAARRKSTEKVLGEHASDDGIQHEVLGSWNEEGHEEPLVEGHDELSNFRPTRGTKVRRVVGRH